MKLVHPDMQMQIILKEGIVHEWILESPALFSRFVGELVVQADGGEGIFVLSEDMKNAVKTVWRIRENRVRGADVSAHAGVRR